MNRQSAPEIKAIDSLKTGFPEKDKNLYILNSEEGVFKLEIIFPHAGYGITPNKYHGIYGMDLLLSGTKAKTASEIADEIDTLGGFIFKGCDYYSSSITIFGMNENILKLLEIIKDSLTNCLYDSKELDIYKSRKISELNINLNKTSYLANRSINQLILGTEHPYSSSSSEDTINSVTQEDLLTFRKDLLTEPFFIFTGSENTQIKNILELSGFDIKEAAVSKVENVFTLPETNTEDYILKKGSTQNSIRIGKILPSRTHKDYFTLSLLNLILGGYFGSRLMKNIREEKGLTYGIHSSMTPFKNFTVFKISSECNSLLTNQVREEIIKEIRQLQVQPVEAEELIIAKNYLLGALSRNFDGAFNISERLKSFLDLESEKDFYQNYFKAINQLTASELQECANNYFDINTLKYCVSGEV
jgi:zinc protease